MAFETKQILKKSIDFAKKNTVRKLNSFNPIETKIRRTSDLISLSYKILTISYAIFYRIWHSKPNKITEKFIDIAIKSILGGN